MDDAADFKNAVQKERPVWKSLAENIRWLSQRMRDRMRSCCPRGEICDDDVDACPDTYDNPIELESKLNAVLKRGTKTSPFNVDGFLSGADCSSMEQLYMFLQEEIEKMKVEVETFRENVVILDLFMKELVQKYDEIELRLMESFKASCAGFADPEVQLSRVRRTLESIRAEIERVGRRKLKGGDTKPCMVFGGVRTVLTEKIRVGMEMLMDLYGELDEFAASLEKVQARIKDCGAKLGKAVENALRSCNFPDDESREDIQRDVYETIDRFLDMNSVSDAFAEAIEEITRKLTQATTESVNNTQIVATKLSHSQDSATPVRGDSKVSVVTNDLSALLAADKNKYDQYDNARAADLFRRLTLAVIGNTSLQSAMDSGCSIISSALDMDTAVKIEGATNNNLSMRNFINAFSTVYGIKLDRNIMHKLISQPRMCILLGLAAMSAPLRNDGVKDWLRRAGFMSQFEDLFNSTDFKYLSVIIRNSLDIMSDFQRRGIE
jgi:hypothetical protein